MTRPELQYLDPLTFEQKKELIESMSTDRCVWYIERLTRDEFWRHYQNVADRILYCEGV